MSRPYGSAAEEPNDPEPTDVSGISVDEAVSEYMHSHRELFLDDLGEFSGSYWTERTACDSIDTTLGATVQQQAALDAAAMRAFRLAWSKKLRKIVKGHIEDGVDEEGPLASWVQSELRQMAEPHVH